MVDMTLNDLKTKVKVIRFVTSGFLADRTNGRAIATLLRLSSVVVCDVMYCG